jgi:hypothetical protein
MNAIPILIRIAFTPSASGVFHIEHAASSECALDLDFEHNPYVVVVFVIDVSGARGHRSTLSWSRTDARRRLRVENERDNRTA